MQPEIATSLAVSLFTIEQGMKWAAVAWNISMCNFAWGASLILPDYQVRPPTR